jgi:hypothetical protein
MGCQADNGTKESVSVNMSAANPKWIDWGGRGGGISCLCHVTVAKLQKHIADMHGVYVHCTGLLIFSSWCAT